tara:strand:- start:338 stop:943 length:606 start_codon:yes stop_codon:yes gene_type:complete
MKMDNEDILGLFIIFFVLAGIALIYFRNFEEFQLKCIVSTVDGNKYCVRERSEVQNAVDLLAIVTKKCKQLVAYMNDKYPDEERVKRLVDGFNPKKIMETLPTSQFTAYSENKGEKIAFCLNKKKGENENLIDEKTLTFVAIHELSHVMTLSIGHKAEFWENFKFLLENAKEAGIHQPVDYKSQPASYCGMNIHDNPYYDA